MTVTLIKDFKNDLKECILSNLDTIHLEERLKVFPNTKDISDLKNKKLEDLVLGYANWRSRFLCGRKRKVHLSKEIYRNSEYIKYKNDLLKIKRMFENGSDLRPFLSTKVNNVSFKDPLLNHWGIYHLHFVPKLRNKDSKPRKNEILFIKIEHENAYFINIFKHGDWVNTDALEIIKRNWPELIEKYRLKDLGSTDSFSEVEMKNFRKNNGNVLMNVDGGVYMMNYGVTSSGHPITLVQQMDSLIEYVEAIEKYLEDYKEDTCFQILENTGKTLDKLNIELIIARDGVCFLEKTHGIKMIFKEMQCELYSLLKKLYIV